MVWKVILQGFYKHAEWRKLKAILSVLKGNYMQAPNSTTHEFQVLGLVVHRHMLQSEGNGTISFMS